MLLKYLKIHCKITNKTLRFLLPYIFLELLHKRVKKWDNTNDLTTKYFIFNATFLHKALIICTQVPVHSTQLLVVMIVTFNI